MSDTPIRHCIAFDGARRIADGPLATVARAVVEWLDRHPRAQPLLFDDATGEPIDLDWRGGWTRVRKQLPADAFPPPAPDTTPAPAPRAPGRPRLGVTAREVTLMPRHWDWLASQPGGASVALRKLVEQARRENESSDRERRAREACYKFMLAMAGNQAGFEEATRALFAGDAARFERHVRAWPAAVRQHAAKLAQRGFAGTSAAAD